MSSITLKTPHTLAVAPALLAAGFVGLAATIDTEAGTTFCLFRICTGGYCPGCGGSRAVAALIKGDLSGSWTLHPWVPLIVAQLLLAAAAVSVWGRDLGRRAIVPALMFNIVLGLSIWGFRLAAGSIPAP